MEHTNKKLKLVFGDVVLGVHGDGFSYLFSYQTGGIESLCIGGKEWLYRTPTPTFWRRLRIMTGAADFLTVLLCGWEQICSGRRKK